MNKNISDLARETQERNLAEEIKIKKEKLKNSDPKIEQRQKALMFKTAFVPKWFTKFNIILFFSFSAVCISYLVINYPLLNTFISILLIIASLISAALLTFVISRVLKAYFISNGHSQLKRFPYIWNKEVYTEILSTEFFNLKLILRITFNSSVQTGRQKQTVAALESLTKGKLTKGTSIIWKTEDHTEIISPEIRAYKYHHPGGYEAYNRQIHLWFKTITSKVLSVIHREHPIKQVNFSIEKKDMKEIFSKRKEY